MGIEIIKDGETAEEAVEVALEELGVERQDVDVEILEESTKGFLGIGNKSARVKVSVRPEILSGAPAEESQASAGSMDIPSTESHEATEGEMELAETASKFIKGLVTKLDIPCEVEPSVQDGSPSVMLDGEELGLLIGRRGETLQAMQTLLSAHISRHAGHRVYASLDIQGYKERKQESLEGLAERIGQKVASSGQAYTMRPMSAADRRIVHMWIKDSPGVSSFSEGQDPNRRVVIEPD